MGYPPFWDEDQHRLYAQIKAGAYDVSNALGLEMVDVTASDSVSQYGVGRKLCPDQALISVSNGDLTLPIRCYVG